VSVRESSITGGFFTDSTGVDLAVFIDATLHKNNKDRQMLLQLEHELRLFVVDASYVVPFALVECGLVCCQEAAVSFPADEQLQSNGMSPVGDETDP
jgi:hypothetical protein